MRRKTIFLLLGLLLILTGCLPKTGTVSGYVKDVMNTPIPDVAVTVNNFTVHTNVDGYYSIAKVPAGTQVVQAQKTGYQDYTGAVTAVAGKTVNHNISIVPLISGGNLTGILTDSLTGLPVSGVAVTMGTYSTTTDSQGRFWLLSIPAGQYTFRTVKTGYVPGECPVVIEINVAKTLNLALVSNVYGNIAGTIRDKSGSPLAGVAVSAGGITATSANDGTYRLYAVPAGMKTLTAEKNGYKPYSGQISVQAGAEASHNFQMTIVSTITGCVTDGAGGPAVADAAITFLTNTVTTDAGGLFRLTPGEDQRGDIFVEKTARGTVRVQDIHVAEGQTMNLEIPSRKAFNPTWSKTPPLIETNIHEGQNLTGSVPVHVEVSGDRPILKIFLYFGGEQRLPAQAVVDGTGDTLDLNLNTAMYPNGSQILRIVAYDDNGNAALLRVPVEVSNTASDISHPAALAKLDITSYTFGRNIGFYQLRQAERARRTGSEINPDLPQLAGQTIDLMAAPSDASLFVTLNWTSAQGAKGYSVYRSFDGSHFTLIGNVKDLKYDDFSSQLEVNRQISYRVVPYNSAGEGEGIEAYVIPSSPFNVLLLGPGNRAVNVPLTPTFSWRLQPQSGFMTPSEYFSSIVLYDDQGTNIWETMIQSDTEIQYNDLLQPGRMYSWDITSCYTDAVYRNQENGMSRALSIAGPYTNGAPYGTGSVNGEFIFTTTNSLP